MDEQANAMSPLRLEVCRAEGSPRFFWRVMRDVYALAGSGILDSRVEAIAAANLLKTNTSECRFEVVNTADRDYPFSWQVRAEDDRVLVVSTNMYALSAGADAVKDYVRDWAPYAPVVLV